MIISNHLLFEVMEKDKDLMIGLSCETKFIVLKLIKGQSNIIKTNSKTTYEENNFKNPAFSCLVRFQL